MLPRSRNQALFRRLKSFLRKTWRQARERGFVGLGLRLAVAFFLGSTALLGLMFLWYSRDLPNPDSLVARNIPQSTKIFDKTGTHLLYEIAPEEKRTLVKIEDIPRCGSICLRSNIAHRHWQSP